MDRVPVPCSTFLNWINAGWIHRAESARISNGVFILEGGLINSETGQSYIWTTLTPLPPEDVITVSDDALQSQKPGQTPQAKDGKTFGEFAACVEKYSFSNSNLGLSGMHLVNFGLNVPWGRTPRSGAGMARHETSWQHRVGSWLSRRLGSKWQGIFGKASGKALVYTTVFQGGWEFGNMMDCAVRGDPSK